MDSACICAVIVRVAAPSGMSQSSEHRENSRGSPESSQRGRLSIARAWRSEASPTFAGSTMIQLGLLQSMVALVYLHP